MAAARNAGRKAGRDAASRRAAGRVILEAAIVCVALGGWRVEAEGKQCRGVMMAGAVRLMREVDGQELEFLNSFSEGTCISDASAQQRLFHPAMCIRTNCL